MLNMFFFHRYLFYRELADLNKVKCSICCSSSFASVDNLRQHLSELQNKLDEIHCYACNQKMDSLQCYVEHLENCSNAQLHAKKDHITTIECSTFSPSKSENVSPSKMAAAGLKIIRLPGPSNIANFNSMAKVKTIKILSPKFSKDGQLSIVSFKVTLQIL